VNAKIKVLVCYHSHHDHQVTSVRSSTPRRAAWDLSDLLTILMSLLKVIKWLQRDLRLRTLTYFLRFVVWLWPNRFFGRLSGLGVLPGEPFCSDSIYLYNGRAITPFNQRHYHDLSVPSAWLSWYHVRRTHVAAGRVSAVWRPWRPARNNCGPRASYVRRFSFQRLSKQLFRSYGPPLVRTPVIPTSGNVYNRPFPLLWEG
jgi:hypothetical protein